MKTKGTVIVPNNLGKYSNFNRLKFISCKDYFNIRFLGVFFIIVKHICPLLFKRILITNMALVYETIIIFRNIIQQ